MSDGAAPSGASAPAPPKPGGAPPGEARLLSPYPAARNFGRGPEGFRDDSSCTAAEPHNRYSEDTIKE